MKRKSHKKRTRSKLLNLEKMRLKHRITFLIIGVVGTVLVSRGIWQLFDSLPVVGHPVVSIIAGFSFIVFSGAFFIA